MMIDRSGDWDYAVQRSHMFNATWSSPAARKRKKQESHEDGAA